MTEYGICLTVSEAMGSGNSLCAGQGAYILARSRVQPIDSSQLCCRFLRQLELSLTHCKYASSTTTWYFESTRGCGDARSNM